MNRNPFFPLIAVLVGGVVGLAGCHGKAGGDNADDSGHVATLVTVQVGQLTRATLHGYVNGFGAVEPAPASGTAAAAVARVASPSPGVVQQVFVAEGARVKQGDTLLQLADRGAQVAVKNARENADRQKQLYAESNTSLKNLQDAEAQLATAEAQLALLHVTAPLSGTVTRVNVRPGEAVDLTTVVAEITDLSRLVVSADIPAADAAQLKPGQPVEIGGEPRRQTTLNFVSPAVDPATGTVTVRAAVPPDEPLRPGAMVAVRITTQEHAHCLAAPADSVVANADGQEVVSVVRGNEATQVPVKTGLTDGKLVEITGEGLKPGDTVVTVGAYGLPAKTQVQIEKP